MAFPDAFRQAMVEGDFVRCGQLWADGFPNMPRPKDIEAAMHKARTASISMPDPKRIYSHNWLEERLLPSDLPDELKPEKPVFTYGIGVSVNSMSKREDRVEEAKAVEFAMGQAGASAMSDGVEDTVLIKKIMREAGNKIYDLSSYDSSKYFQKEIK